MGFKNPNTQQHYLHFTRRFFKELKNETMRKTRLFLFLQLNMFTEKTVGEIHQLIKLRAPADVNGISYTQLWRNLKEFHASNLIAFKDNKYFFNQKTINNG